MADKLTKILANLPDSPGVYLYYNKSGELIYIGKATSLESRVRSYFRGARTPRPIEQMIHEVENIKWEVTDSVLEAIILEANSIKKHQPKYNVDGKDDKSWNYIGITDDEYSRVITVRQHELVKEQGTKSKEQYWNLFGPYPGLNTKAAMKILARLFNISFCKPNQKRPCLYYQMGQCLGVCTGEISAQEYKQKVICPLVALLSGRKKQLLKNLEIQMRKESKLQNFEEAARLRNQIHQLQRIQDIALMNKSFVEADSSHRSVRDPAQGREKQISDNNLIRRIEGYDISNLGETGKVGSMVVFSSGEPDKSQYRKFKIRTVDGQSDVDCLAEVIERRLRHAEWPYPDLFLIDGGKPQVNKVREILYRNKIKISVVGIAKGPERKKNEFINLLPTHYHLQPTLIRVRDEAHRFAITYQRSLRRLQ